MAQPSLELPSEGAIAESGHLLGLRPLRYQLDVAFPDKSRFSAAVEMVVKVEEDTPLLALHADTLNLDVDLSAVIVVPYCLQGPAVCVSRVENASAHQTLLFHLTGVLKAGSVYRVFLPKAKGRLPNELAVGSGGSVGFFLANSMQPSWAIGTIFQMRYARTVFPSFDHPALKVHHFALPPFFVEGSSLEAKFMLTLRHPLNTTGASSMPALGPAEREGDSLVTSFGLSPPMSTYVFTLSVLHDMAVFASHPRAPVPVEVQPIICIPRDGGMTRGG